MPIKSLCWLYLMKAWAEEDGTTAIEYAFIISLISIAIGFMIPELRAQIDELMGRTSSALTAAAASSQAP
jgi:Flp pilus assembly pilin Flp